MQNAQNNCGRVLPGHTVMPVMEVRDDVAQRAETYTHVGMVEHRLEADDDDVGVYDFLENPSTKIGASTSVRVSISSRMC